MLDMLIGGTLTGPYHPTFNPGGQSNSVSDNILFTPWGKDSDSDLIPDHTEDEVICLDANDDDSDGDGLLDGSEDINLNGIVDANESNPCTSDSDGDGLSDGEEVNLHTTNPTLTDTDDDGMPDGWEVDHGLNPKVNDALGDANGDGISNIDEYNSLARKSNLLLMVIPAIINARQAENQP